MEFEAKMPKVVNNFDEKGEWQLTKAPSAPMKMQRRTLFSILSSINENSTYKDKSWPLQGHQGNNNTPK